MQIHLFLHKIIVKFTSNFFGDDMFCRLCGVILRHEKEYGAFVTLFTYHKEAVRSE